MQAQGREEHCSGERLVNVSGFAGMLPLSLHSLLTSWYSHQLWFLCVLVSTWHWPLKRLEPWLLGDFNLPFPWN